MPKLPGTISDVTTYSALLRRVKETLLDGQRAIEAEKIRTYWLTGRLLQTHILHNQERAEYGAEVMVRLAEDLKVDASVLRRCRRFFERYSRGPIQATSPQLTWSHYQELIDIPDDKERSLLEKAVVNNGLTIEEVRARKRDLRQRGMKETGEREASVSLESGESALPVPVRGPLYTYRVLRRKALASGPTDLVVDLGFSVTHEADTRLFSHLADGDIIESKPTAGAFRFVKSGRTQKDLFTYKAFVEKVIDGDTLKVQIDLGFEMWIGQTLRLRGIDCPELNTKPGDEARAYVRSLLKEADEITVRTFKPDKYDRYLVDIFIPGDGKKEACLNSLLLEKGHARRWGV